MAKDSTATIIFKGDDQISPAIKGATASVAGLKQGLGTVDTEAKKTSDSIRDNLVKQIEAAQQKVKDFAAAGLKSDQGKALGELNKLRNELKKLDEPVGANALDPLAASANKTAVQIKAELTKSIESVNQELAKLSTQKLSPEVRLRQEQLLGQLSELKTQLKDIDKLVVQPEVQLDPLQLNAISQSFGAIAGKLTELRTAAVGAFGEIAKAERKLSTVSDQSKELIKNFGNLAAANKFQTTTAELAGASYEVISAGFTKTADATKILDASTKGAVGGFSDVTTVSKATVSALNAYGKGADDAASFVGKFVSVQQSGLITVDQYAQQLPRIAPTAALAKLSIDELNGAIATATASGVPVEATFSGLRTALGAILKPTSEASKYAKDLKVQFNATALQTKGLSGVLKELKATGNASAEALLNLFGSQEAVAAIAPLIADLDKLDANIKASANSADLLGSNFDKAADPLKAFANQTTEALAVLGANIVKVFNPVLSATKAVVQAFIDLPEPLQQIIAFVVGGGAAIASTGAAISAFLAILSPTLAGLSALATGVTTAIGFLTAGQIALGTATATTTGLTAAEAAAFSGMAAASGTATGAVGGLSTATTGLGGAAVGAIAKIGALATASISLKSVVGTIGGLLAGAGALVGTLAIKAVFAVSSIIVAIAPLVLTLGTLYLAFESIRNTIGLFGEINSNKAEEAFDKILNKSDAVDQKIKEATKTSESFFDKLGGGFDKVENPIQGSALAFTNLINALIGAESGSSKFGSSFGLITQQQLEAQKATIAYGNAISQFDGTYQMSVNTLNKYGTALTFEKNLTKLSADEKKKYSKVLEKTTERLKKEISQLEAFGKVKGVDQATNQAQIKATKTLLEQSNLRIEILKNAAKQSEAVEKKSAEAIEEIVKGRIEKEKRGLEDRARISGRAFEKQSNAEKDTFEEKSRTEKRTFEKQLNLDKEAFEDSQKADKKKFEDEQRTETKRFTDAQKADQKRFNAEEKASDKAYEKEKQVAQRAFDKEQQAQKEAFDKKQREENLAFDKAQDAAKKTADDQFAKRRLEIERKLQLDAAKTPEDKAKLEAEFKLVDEKAAKEKAAFEQLKADELAFAEKQKADKIAFDEAQKAAQKAEDEAQKIAKQTFDNAQKLRDDERELAKELRKETFETQLNVKKEEFEAAQNLKKEANEVALAKIKEEFDDKQNAKKQKFEDDERLKKAAFDEQQNAKKVAFEDAERKKKEAFEDNLKTLEAKFNAEERAKDIATAQQVAAIKLGGSAGAFNAAVGIATPRAKGGSFRAGQQLLVGERGQELVTFGSGGYVSNATDTKQILSSNNKAPSSVSTARMEALLTQLVGKLDRPNVAITTSENPSDAYVKIQREAARADAMRSGI